MGRRLHCCQHVTSSYTYVTSSYTYVTSSYTYVRDNGKEITLLTTCHVSGLCTRDALVCMCASLSHKNTHKDTHTDTWSVPRQYNTLSLSDTHTHTRTHTHTLGLYPDDTHTHSLSLCLSLTLSVPTRYTCVDFAMSRAARLYPA